MLDAAVHLAPNLAVISEWRRNFVLGDFIPCDSFINNNKKETTKSERQTEGWRNRKERRIKRIVKKRRER